MTDARDRLRGAVTLVLGDVKGSTPLWSDDPTGAARSIEGLGVLVGDIVARHGGTRPPEQGEGDRGGVVASRRRHARATGGTHRRCRRAGGWEVCGHCLQSMRSAPWARAWRAVPRQHRATLCGGQRHIRRRTDLGRGSHPNGRAPPRPRSEAPCVKAWRSREGQVKWWCESSPRRNEVGMARLQPGSAGPRGVAA